MAAFASECAKLKQELQEVKKGAGKLKKEKQQKNSATEISISNSVTDASQMELLQQRCSALEKQNMVCFSTKLMLWLHAVTTVQLSHVMLVKCTYKFLHSATLAL